MFLVPAERSVSVPPTGSVSEEFLPSAHVTRGFRGASAPTKMTVTASGVIRLGLVLAYASEFAVGRLLDNVIGLLARGRGSSMTILWTSNLARASAKNDLSSEQGPESEQSQCCPEDMGWLDWQS